jgi:Na+/H+ antiporter NhaC
VGRYAKAIVAAVGAGATAALGIFAPHTWPWSVAIIVSAMATALGVRQVENK